MSDVFFASAVARVNAALGSKLADDMPIAYATGAAEISRHGDALARVVWVWRGGRLAATTRTPFRTEDKRQLRPLYDDLARVQAWLRAKDDEALEVLWLRMLTALRRVFGTGCTPGEYEHQHSSSTAVSGRSDAREMVQEMTWRLTVCSQQLPDDDEPSATLVLGFNNGFSFGPL